MFIYMPAYHIVQGGFMSRLINKNLYCVIVCISLTIVLPIKAQVFFSEDTIFYFYDSIIVSDSIILYNNSPAAITVDTIRVLESPCENGFSGYISFNAGSISEINLDNYCIFFELNVAPINEWPIENRVIDQNDSLLIKNYTITHTNLDNPPCTRNDTSISFFNEVFECVQEFKFSDGSRDTLVYVGNFIYGIIDGIISRVPNQIDRRIIKVNKAIVHNGLNLPGTGRGDKLYLFDLKGNLLKKITLESDNAKISDLPSGAGLLIIEDKKGITYMRYINVK